MSKDLDIFYFSNVPLLPLMYSLLQESKVTDFLRKICYDKIKYSNSICGWQREYFIRVFYHRMHYHLNVRVVAFPKEVRKPLFTALTCVQFRVDVSPSACTFLIGANSASARFVRRSRRHIKRECQSTPSSELNIFDVNFLVSSRRSEITIEEDGRGISVES